MTGRSAVVALLLVTAGCAADGRMRREVAAIRENVERAKRSGAQRCAPRELALAVANADLAEAEMASGHGLHAEEHLKVAAPSARRALELSRACGAAPIAVRKEPPGRARATDRKDSDRDGTPDEIDRCPLDAEDRDRFQDEDGCPDPDDDRDGIVDRMDGCPREAGPLESRGCPAGAPGDRDRDGVADRVDRCPDQLGPAPEGCPRKYSLVEVKHERIVIRQQVHFATGRAEVMPDSRELLGQVVQVLKDFPRMRLSIEGHTDSVGSPAANMQLSQRRADAVRQQLVSRGIAPDRLQAAGLGPTRPVASNGTARGRAQNRRTDFRILAVE